MRGSYVVLCAKVFVCGSSFFSGIVVTNDGNAILRELDVAHPAAKVLFFFFVPGKES